MDSSLRQRADQWFDQLFAVLIPGLLVFYLFSSAISRYFVFERDFPIAQQMDELVLVLVILLVALSILVSKRFHFEKVFILIIAFGAWGWVPTLINQVPLKIAIIGFLQTIKPLIILSAFMLIPWQSDSSARLKSNLDRLFVWLPIVAVFYSILIEHIFGLNFIDPVNPEMLPRLGVTPSRSFFPHANTFGAMMAFCAMYLFPSWLEKRDRVYLLSLVTALIGVLMTTRIKPMLLLPVCLLIIFALFHAQKGQLAHQTWRLIIIGMLVVLALSLILTVLLWDIFSMRLSLEKPGLRLNLLINALRIQKDSGTLGVGYGMYGSPASVSQHFSPLYYQYGLVSSVPKPVSTESASYLVIETGQWQLANGVTLIVDSNEIWKYGEEGDQTTTERILFNEPFPRRPVVISQVQSSNDHTWVKSRIEKVTADGFNVALENLGFAPSPHDPEIVGWLAIEPVANTQVDPALESGYVTSSPDLNRIPIDFKVEFTIPPHLFADVASIYGRDPVIIRLQSISKEAAQLLLQKDQSDDREQYHQAELIAFIAVGSTARELGVESIPPSVVRDHDGRVIGEVGRINSIPADRGQTVELANIYEKPVAFISPISLMDEDPAESRIVTLDAQNLGVIIHGAKLTPATTHGGYRSNFTDQWWSWFLGETGVWGMFLILLIFGILFIRLFQIGAADASSETMMQRLSLLSIGLLAYAILIGMAGTTLAGPPGSYWTFGIIGTTISLSQAQGGQES